MPVKLTVPPQLAVVAGVPTPTAAHPAGYAAIIAAHDLRQIFEPFYRSRDSQARRRKGTGIGLTITRYIMEAHGGDIQVQSKLGKGSTFILRFPLEPPVDTDRGTRFLASSGRHRAGTGA